MDEILKKLKFLWHQDPRDFRNQERVAEKLEEAHLRISRLEHGAEWMRELLVCTRGWLNEQKVCQGVHDTVVYIFGYWHQFCSSLALDPACKLPDMFIVQEPAPGAAHQLQREYTREKLGDVQHALLEAQALMKTPGPGERLPDLQALVAYAAWLVGELQEALSAPCNKDRVDKLENSLRRDLGKSLEAERANG